MNKLKISSLIGGMVLFMLGCADPDLAPIITFDQAGKGAYVRLIEESDKLINILDDNTIANSTYIYTVEFVDINQGALVTSYDLVLTYRNAVTNETTNFPFRSYSADQFEDFASGFKGLSNIEVTASELISLAGLTNADINPGDQFQLDGTVTLQDGSTFAFDNSTGAVNGPSFSGHFRYILPAGCPSDLTGEFPFVATDFWCNGGGANGTTTITALGGGSYTFDDWSWGGYGACYGGGTNSGGTLAFSDVCTQISFTGFDNSFGDVHTFTSTIVGDQWTINWENTYGESGSVVITNPNGDWNLTIAE